MGLHYSIKQNTTNAVLDYFGYESDEKCSKA